MNKTKIEWTDYTANPIKAVNMETGKRGHFCVKESSGCRHCYSEGWNLRFGNGLRYTAANIGKVGWVLDDKELQRICSVRKPAKIFIGDMTDLFQEDISFVFLDPIFAVMQGCPHLTFQILTKHPDRMLEYYKSREITEPLENAWLMTSVEKQEHTDRIGYLLQCPAVVRGVSLEPLLGPVDLTKCAPYTLNGDVSNPGIIHAFSGSSYHPATIITAPPTKATPDGINWVICGGESGTGARPVHPDWVRSIRDQCKEAEVPFFFKQWGAWQVFYDRDNDDPDCRRCPNVKSPSKRWLNLVGGHGFHGDRVVAVRRVGKKKTGRLLDGVEHSEFPKPNA